MLLFLAILFCTAANSVYSKPLKLTKDEANCAGYAACHPIDHEKINVHIVAHSQDDVGWIKTVDQYFYRNVQYIISSTIAALKDNPDRRFVQAETAYLYRWWNLQSDNRRSEIVDLVNTGQLEIVGGGWSQSDEATAHYQSTIDQFTLGLNFLEQNLGKCARPKVGWQIAPYGHSKEFASLLAQIGMEAVFFSRTDYRDQENRENKRSMDMFWASSSNLGNDSTIFASELYKQYNSPDNFCFDYLCKDSPIVTDEDSSEYNWEEKVNSFTDWIKKMYTSYPTSHVLAPFGGDFSWEAAHTGFVNIDRLIEGFKKFNPIIDGKEVNLIYSTPSCYVKSVRDYVEEKKVTLDVKVDDFFPIADNTSKVWAGYYTSRPTSKRLERYGNNLLQVTRQLTSLAKYPKDTNYLLEQAMGVFQNHDAIAGTERAVVEKDYHKSFLIGMDSASTYDSLSLSKLLGSAEDLNLKSCFLSNVSICEESADKDEFNVLLYNPLARKTSHYIQIPVDDGKWRVTGPSGEEIESRLTDPISNFDYITRYIPEKMLEKVLFFKATDLPALGYKVYNLKKISSAPEKSEENSQPVKQVGFTDRYVNFDESTGLLESVTINGVTMKVSQKLMFYNSSRGESGAYIFKPDRYVRDAQAFPDTVITTVLTNEGNVIREVKQVWADWATQIVRIYKDEDFIEFDWVVGPIDVSHAVGKEVIARYTTELTNVNEIFYTDANGREMVQRKKDYRPTFDYTNEEPQADNYYPVNTRIFIKNEEEEFAVITDRSEGGSSLNSGEIELMLHRALVIDEGKGLDQALNEREYNLGVVARGSHYVTLGKTINGNGDRTMAVVERDIAQRKLLQPWVFYTSQDVAIKEQSFLKNELPENIHLLTLDRWNASTDTFLIRLEHILEKHDDPNLSKEVTVDLSDVFKIFTIKSIKEYMLAANEPLEEDSRLHWSQVGDNEDERSPLNKANRLSREETDLKITLAPMQIRTFVASVEYNY